MTTTLIAKRARVGGRIETEGDVLVEGRVEGQVVAAGCVTIGVGGVAVSEIQAGRAVILGIVIGNVLAKERIDIAASARVVGDVKAPQVAVATTGLVEGKIEETGGVPPTEALPNPRPTLRIRGGPLIRPARPEPAAEAPSAAPTRQTGDLGAAPRLRTRDPSVVPLPPKPPARVRMSPRRLP